MEKKWCRIRRRLFEIVEVGSDIDLVSRIYDYFSVFTILGNIAASIMLTYEAVQIKYGFVLSLVEHLTVIFFAIDFLLRVFTAKHLYEEEKLSEGKSVFRYMFSFMGIVDILSWLPYYLPFFFPAGTTVFRMIRVVRIFRLFRINAYYDSFSVIGAVIYGKRQQLLSSVFIILVLMIGASLCMYSLEHEAQPDVFSNAFSGIWWSTSTLLTIGYGDIYPVTTLGKIFGIIISFLGVGMVAIPTGIISAGFVDQYTSIKKKGEFGHQMDLDFVKVYLKEGDFWCGCSVAELKLPSEAVIAMIHRGGEVLIPRGDVVLKAGDALVLGAVPKDGDEKENLELKKIIIQKKHPWSGVQIRDLDISRQSVIVLVRRRNKSLIPNGNMVLEAGDKVFVYTKLHLPNAVVDIL